MPLHVWLPRTHPIAPAPVSALMSGVMIKVAVYALVRVLVDWVGVLPSWFGVLVLFLGALSAVGGVLYAILPARPEAAAGAALDRERGDHRARARRVSRPAGARRGHLGVVRARRRAPAHAEPRRLQVAALPRRRRVREGGRLARARPARRPAQADALDRRGLPRRRVGDRGSAAAQRLLVRVADAAGAAARLRVREPRRRTAGAVALAALGDRRPCGALLRQGARRARAPRPPAARCRRRGRRGAAADVGEPAPSSSRSPASRSVWLPASSSGSWRGSRPGPRPRRRPSGSPARHGLAADARDRGRPRRADRKPRARARPALCRRRPGRAGSSSRAA